MNLAKQSDVIDRGTLSFTIESRIIRELGERLVKQPEVALVELVKNSYDADSTICEISYEPPTRIIVGDDGHGMTLSEFKDGWMRIGTSSKAAHRLSRRFRRIITGEKGIGRFAVRFLGKALHLESVALDPERGSSRTLLLADFSWPAFDNSEDLGKVTVPYSLLHVDDDRAVGTRLEITELRPNSDKVNLRSVRTASIGVVTPYQSMLRQSTGPTDGGRPEPSATVQDPGFSLNIQPATEDPHEGDVARTVIDNYVLRAVLDLRGNRLSLSVYRRRDDEPASKMVDRFSNGLGSVHADIRFFPQRKGTFAGLPIEGKIARAWVKDHSGVAVFDRTFRVHPYGSPGDDWLMLSADTARRAREPRSSLAAKHFPMDEAARTSTQLNYMLRLPYPEQLVGIVQVQGQRTEDERKDEEGLVPSADREGFVDNTAFRQLFDIIRGAVEAIAAEDRELQQDEEREEQKRLLKSLRAETQDAIREIQANPNIARAEKLQIVKRLTQTQALAEQHEERAREREATLEVMSLLGVVAGFMTHEFGTAFRELQESQQRLMRLARRDDSFKESAQTIGQHLANLQEFVAYSQGYVQGASSRPEEAYPVKPRIQQVKRVFGKYAEDRKITVNNEVEGDVIAPLVPVSLYNGVALNLFTNALKAVTAKAGSGERTITFRAWNEQQWHHLEVSDTGIGIPASLRHRIFDPLFTTTASNRDPLGSGMGLGLALVKRGVETYGGHVEVIDPPAGFSTCISVRLPLKGTS